MSFVEVLGQNESTDGLTRVMTLYFPLDIRFMGLLGEVLHHHYEGVVMLNRDPNDTTIVDIWARRSRVAGDFKVVEFDPYEESV